MSSPEQRHESDTDGGRGLHLSHPPEIGMTLITISVALVMLLCCASVILVPALGRMVGGALIAVGEWLSGGATAP